MSGAVEGVALLPCPWCQSEALQILHNENLIGMEAVSCRNCGARGPHVETARQATDGWNTRTTPPAPSYADGVEEAAHRIYDACRPEHPLPYHVCEILAAAAGVPTTASADLQKLIDAIAIWDQLVVEYKPRHAVFEYGNALRNAARSVLASFTTPPARSYADAIEDAAKVAESWIDEAFATDHENRIARSIATRIRLLSQGGKA